MGTDYSVRDSVARCCFLGAAISSFGGGARCSARGSRAYYASVSESKRKGRIFLACRVGRARVTRSKQTEIPCKLHHVEDIVQ